MTTLVDDLINVTRRHVYALQQGKYNFLNGAVAVDDTTVTFALALNGVVPGALISIDEEILYVKSVSGQDATVARGWDDSSAAIHADGAIVEVQPRFPRFAIQTALLEEIRSWPRTLFRKTTATLTNPGQTRAWPLTSIGTTWYSVAEVRFGPTDDATYPVLKGYDVDRGANTLYVPRILDTDHSLKVTYTAPFVTTAFALTTDVVADVGIPASAYDIPAYGAAWRLLSAREIKRTFTESQAEPRQGDAVPVGSASRTAAYMKALRDQRITEEADRLAATVALRW